MRASVLDRRPIRVEDVAINLLEPRGCYLMILSTFVARRRFHNFAIFIFSHETMLGRVIVC